MFGDINKDNRITSRDFLLLLNHVVATTTKKHKEWILSDEQLKVADITGDSKVDSRDYLALLKYVIADNNKEIAKKYPEWKEYIDKKNETPEPTPTPAPEPVPTPTPTPEPSPSPEVVEVSKISLNKPQIKLEIGKTEQLTATIEPENATNKEIEWTSSHEKVATISSNGMVTAKGEGTAIITVTSKSNKKIKSACTVTVEPKQEPTPAPAPTPEPTPTPTPAPTPTPTPTNPTVRSISLTKKSATVTVNDINQITARILPGVADTQAIELTSSDPDKVAIERIIENGTYYIKSALNENKVLEVANGSKKDKAAIQLNNVKKTAEQKFKITNIKNEYYKITSTNSKKVLEVENGSTQKGAKVQQNTSTKKDEQQWEFEYVGNGYYRIKSKVSGLYLNVTDGKATNKAKLQVWTSNKKNAQKFKLEKISKTKPVVENGTYYIKSVLDKNKVLDIEGASKDNKAAVQLYTKNGADAEKFEITYIGNGYYVIRSYNSGKALDVESGDADTNIRQYTYKGTDVQIWKIEKDGENYKFKSKETGLYLNVAGGKAKNKAKLQTHKSTTSKAQKFKLEKIAEMKHSNMEYIILKGKARGTATITAKLADGKTAKCKVEVTGGYWEVKNGKYIYHYADGTKKEFSKSCYVSNEKIKDVIPKEPTIPNENQYPKNNWVKKSFTYAGIKHNAYYCYSSKANKIAENNNGSPYAIVVDI
ncbi:MAG: RICIN domain-containing protein, partial [Clostridia bacterium]|nr:RICIN domain-containing protein [Clostridia bacterium]